MLTVNKGAAEINMGIALSRFQMTFAFLSKTLPGPNKSIGKRDFHGHPSVIRLSVPLTACQGGNTGSEKTEPFGKYLRQQT